MREGAQEFLDDLLDAGVKVPDQAHVLELVSERLDREHYSLDRVAEIIDSLLEGVSGTDDLGRRVMLFAFLFHTSRAAKSLEQLGSDMGVSKTRAHQLIKEFMGTGLNGKKPVFIGEIMNPAERPALG